MTRAGRLGRQYPGGYVRTRSARRPGDTGIEPVRADEAFAGDDALVGSPDPASKPGATGRLVGRLLIGGPRGDRGDLPAGLLDRGERVEGQPHPGAALLRGQDMNQRPRSGAVMNRCRAGGP